MIQMRIDGGAVQWSAAVDNHSVVSRFDICVPYAVRFSVMTAIRSDSLTLSSAASFMIGCPFCKGGEHGNEPEARRSALESDPPRLRCGMQRRGTDQQIGTWLCAAAVFVHESRHLPPIARHDTQHAVTGRIRCRRFSGAPRSPEREAPPR